MFSVFARRGDWHEIRAFLPWDGAPASVERADGETMLGEHLVDRGTGPSAAAAPLRLLGYAQLALATTIMGSVAVVGKIAVAELPVFVTSAARLAVAAPVLLVLAGLAADRTHAPARAAPRAYLWPFLEAVSGVFLGSVCLLAGLQYTSATDAGILLATTPAAGALIAALALRDRIGRTGWMGVGCAVAGALLLTGLEAGGGAAAPHRVLGNALVLGAVVAEGISVTVGKLAADRLPPFTVGAAVVTFALVLMAPGAAWQARGVEFAAVGGAVWIAVVYYGLAGSVCSGQLWFRGLRKVPASTGAAFMGVPPVSAALLSHLLLGERFAWPQALAFACVLAGIACMHRDERMRRPAPQ